MRILVSTTTQELAEMSLTPAQLRDSVTECLNENGCGPDGERLDYSGFVVEVEVVPTVRELFPTTSTQAVAS